MVIAVGMNGIVNMMKGLLKERSGVDTFSEVVAQN
jgi:hypothetical protein